MTTFILVALGLFAVYCVACAVWPYTSCPRCAGRGRKDSPSGKAWRNCQRCGGSGKRLRLGRRLWTIATELNASSRKK